MWSPKGQHVMIPTAARPISTGWPAVLVISSEPAGDDMPEHGGRSGNARTPYCSALHLAALTPLISSHSPRAKIARIVGANSSDDAASGASTSTTLLATN